MTRLATVRSGAALATAVVREDRVAELPSEGPGLASMEALIAGGPTAVASAERFADSVPADAWRALASARFGPAVPRPGAIYTIGANYRPAGGGAGRRPELPKVLGKLPSSVTNHGAKVGRDRSVTGNVDAECELGVVIGSEASVFGYTIVNDLNSADPWLDGDRWLLGKSMAGFCPVGPWIVTADELDPRDIRLGARLNGEPIQDGRTSQMWFTIGDVITYISRHVELRPGDLIATGTPARLGTAAGPDRHLQAGDVVTCWIEGIGELTNTIE
jgi:2-keto-4-pentenoate hydratase/2-oxohepta-3-ene-1,7-dioic acid hydratase in catechol pathway